MADLQSASIDPSKIKVRWEEPYSSEGVNRGLSAVPRGVYRGFVPYPAAVPDKTFLLRIDPAGGGFYADSALLYVDRTNGFALMVRDAAEPSFDMSARFTDAGSTEIPPAGEIWWVWADVDYSTGLATTGDYHVTLDGDPIPDDAIYMGKIDMPGGATTIELSYFSYVAGTERTLPLPTKREDGASVAGDQYEGFLSGEEAWNIPTSDHKRAMNSAATAPTAANPFVTKADTSDKYFGEPSYQEATSLVAVDKVQLSGQFYVGNTTLAQALKFFSLRNHTSQQQLLKTSGGVMIYVGSLYKNDDSAPLVPSTDADANGFYQNPYVYLYTKAGAHTFTGDLAAYCFRKKQFSTLIQAPVQSFPFAGEDPFNHADRIHTEDTAGSPDSLTGSSATGSLGALLGFINARIKTINPVAAPGSTWQLLWRSHNITLDANVTKTTISIYFRDGEYAIACGGYLSGANFVAGNDIGTGDVMSLSVTGITRIVRAIVEKHAGISPGSSWVWDDERNWGSFSSNTPDMGAKAYEPIHVATGVADYPSQIYNGNVAGDNGLFLCWNAIWHWDTIEFEAAGSDNAFMLQIGDDFVSIWYKEAVVAGTKWDGDDVGPGAWDSKVKLQPAGGGLDVFFTAEGEVQDYGWYDMFVIAQGAGTVDVYTSIQFHAELSDVTTEDITIARQGGTANFTGNPTPQSENNRGALISHTTQPLSAGEVARQHGYWSIEL